MKIIIERRGNGKKDQFKIPFFLGREMHHL